MCVSPLLPASSQSHQRPIRSRFSRYDFYTDAASIDPYTSPSLDSLQNMYTVRCCSSRRTARRGDDCVKFYFLDPFHHNGNKQLLKKRSCFQPLSTVICQIKVYDDFKTVIIYSCSVFCMANKHKYRGIVSYGYFCDKPKGMQDRVSAGNLPTCCEPSRP